PHSLGAKIVAFLVRVRLVVAVADRHAGGRSPSQHFAARGKYEGAISEEVSDRLEAGESLRYCRPMLFHKPFTMPDVLPLRPPPLHLMVVVVTVSDPVPFAIGQNGQQALLR